ncbi:glutathione S-transferase family protein [Roseococcus sp.]|uniref:glutathione S-transferase family protein n=1 Tax=Roseococcus sp. TaxID=2109646 RepID=UPI003BA9768D
MLKLYGTPKSRNFRCIWAAEESGLAYEIVPVGFGAPVKSATHLKLNPNGKIPAMEDGELVLFESLAINLHIASKVGAPLSPSGDDYSRVLQWTLWAATEVEPSAGQWAYNAYIRPQEDRDPGQAAAGAAGVTARLDVLEGQLTEAYMVGPEFTIADCNLASVLYGAWSNKFDFGAHTRVKAWLERCFNRPAALAARKLRDAA